jgi:hypothetical protein
MEQTQKLVAANFTLTGILTDKRQITITGYFYAEDTPHERHARVDEYQDIIDRQVIRADLVIKEAEILRNENGLQQLAAHHEALVKRKQKGRKLGHQEVDQLDKYESSVDFFVRSNNSLRAAIDAGRKKLNGAAA